MSRSGLMTRRKNLTAASFSNSLAISTLDELSNNIAKRIGESLRLNSAISATLPSTFSSKSVSLSVPTARPRSSVTETGIGTRTDSTLIISSSIFTEGVVAAIGFGDGVADVSTDGPLIERGGVGVGLGFVRPDCA